jgi:7,8-dihydropterin-6-yl-methyl-4-(beta-D-ribofuranosyl)aminobenzene 5'-phosphate synthase
MKPNDASAAPPPKTTKAPCEATKLQIKSADKVEITSLVDNTIDLLSTNSHPAVQSLWYWCTARQGQKQRVHMPLGEHGFSLFVRVYCGGKSTAFLFDAGGSPQVAVANAQTMGLDLGEVEFVVLSHGHYDHFGGLLSVLSAIGKKGLPLIVHEDMFKPRGTAYKNGNVQPYPAFPTTQELSSTELIYTKQPTLYANGVVCVTGEIPRRTSFEQGLLQHQTFRDGAWQPDSAINDERAVILNVKDKGLIVLSGCAHAGIINTLLYAQEISDEKRVHAVLGGFHLAGRSFEPKIGATVTELVKLKPWLVVPSHCTGWRALFAIHEALPEAFVWNSVGNRYQL